jgi:hypothetical protein
MKSAFCLPKFCVLTMIVLLVTTSGCRTLMLGHPAKIGQSEWAYLKAVYLVRDETGVHAESWRTRDRKVLKQLCASFPRDAELDITYNVPMNKCNRVDIELRNGQRWVISYFRHSGGMTFFDPVWAKRSYRLDDVGPEFYEALTQAIELDTGKKVDFFIKVNWDNIKLQDELDATEYGQEWK